MKKYLKITLIVFVLFMPFIVKANEPNEQIDNNYNYYEEDDVILKQIDENKENQPEQNEQQKPEEGSVINDEEEEKESVIETTTTGENNNNNNDNNQEEENISPSNEYLTKPQSKGVKFYLYIVYIIEGMIVLITLYPLTKAIKFFARERDENNETEQIQEITVE